jgi:hypothetical protein
MAFPLFISSIDVISIIEKPRFFRASTISYGICQENMMAFFLSTILIIPSI